MAAPGEVAGAGLGRHRQVNAEGSSSKMSGMEQGQIQLQGAPGQKGQHKSAAEQGEVQGGSRKQEETRDK